MFGFHCKKRGTVTLTVLVDKELAIEALEDDQGQHASEFSVLRSHHVWPLVTRVTEHLSGTQMGDVEKEQSSEPVMVCRSPVVMPYVCERLSQVPVEARLTLA